VGKIFTVDQVAEQLQVKPDTIRIYLRRGDLRGFRLGREWRIREEDLQAFIDKQLQGEH
jgi:excisionase family DNA binding protein